MAKNRQSQIYSLASTLREKVTKKENIEIAHAPGREDRSKHAVVIRTTPITWLMPFDEVCFTKAWRSQMQLRMMPWDDLITVENTYLLEGRTKLWNDFLEYGQTDWAFMLDSDVACPPNTLHKLLEHARADPEKKVLAAWYRIKAEPYHPVVYRYVGVKKDHRGNDIDWWVHYETYEIKEGLEKVDGIGAGCLLVHKDVVKAIGKDPFVMHGGGEDLQLCKHLVDRNIPIWLDWDLKCAHVGVGLA